MFELNFSYKKTPSIKIFAFIIIKFHFPINTKTCSQEK